MQLTQKSEPIEIGSKSKAQEVTEKILGQRTLFEALNPVDQLLKLIASRNLPNVNVLSPNDIYEEYNLNRSLIEKLSSLIKNEKTNPNQNSKQTLSAADLDQVGLLIRLLDTRCLALYDQQNTLKARAKIENLNPNLLIEKRMSKLQGLVNKYHQEAQKGSFTSLEDHELGRKRTGTVVQKVRNFKNSLSKNDPNTPGTLRPN